LLHPAIVELNVLPCQSPIVESRPLLAARNLPLSGFRSFCGILESGTARLLCGTPPRGIFARQPCASPLFWVESNPSTGSGFDPERSRGVEGHPAVYFIYNIQPFCTDVKIPLTHTHLTESVDIFRSIPAIRTRSPSHQHTQ